MGLSLLEDENESQVRVPEDPRRDDLHSTGCCNSRRTLLTLLLTLVENTARPNHVYEKQRRRLQQLLFHPGRIYLLADFFYWGNTV